MPSDSPTLIRLSDVSKRYRLGEIGTGALTLDIEQLFGRWFKRGKRNVENTPSTDSEREIWAIRNLSLDVQRGEVLGVIGGNGAGKSTLLKLLSQITLPTTGRIKTKGRIGSLLEVGTGFHPELTGRENIYLNGAILGMQRHEINRQLDAIVEFSGCEKFIDTPVKRYSTGMVVRLGFAVAAHLECEILIVDEVLAVGDIGFQRKCLGKIKEVSSGEGKTVLFVSHNLGILSNVCSRGIVLRQGEMVFDGEVDQAIRTYLSDASRGQTEIVADDQVAIGQEVKLRRARITTQDGSQQSTILNSNPALVEIDFEVLQDGSSYSISVEVVDEIHGPVFSTTTLDSRPATDLGDFPATGSYTAICELPTSMMRGGSYTVNIACAIPCVKVVDRMKHSISFEIVDDQSPVAILGEPRRGAVIPRLDWKIAPRPGADR